MKKLFHVWFLLAKQSAQVTMVNRGTSLLFMIGKVFRFLITITFILMIKKTTPDFGQYQSSQVIIFFLTYHFVDLIAQTIFRGVYQFSYEIRMGDFDFQLTKPLPSFFYALLGKPDLNDAVFIMPSLAVGAWLVTSLSLTFTITQIAWYCLLFINALIIATALHLVILSATIIFVEVDGLVWLYRDLFRLGQFPASIYASTLKFALFFIIPIGLMTTVPAEILLGHQPSVSLALVLTTTICVVLISYQLWQQSLRHYTSASS